MNTVCPRDGCGNLAAVYRAKDEAEVLQLAQQRKLTGFCYRCDNVWTISEEEQAKVVKGLTQKSP
jgi:hypothetical protein